MAAAKKGTNKKLPVKDLSIWWSDLQALPPEDKNELWAAEVLYFAKKNAKLFLDPKRAAVYRGNEKQSYFRSIYKVIR